MAGMKHFQAYGHNIPGLGSFGGFVSQVAPPSFFLSSAKALDMKSADHGIPFLSSGKPGHDEMSPEKPPSSKSPGSTPATSPGSPEAEVLEPPPPGMKSMPSSMEDEEVQSPWKETGGSAFPNGDDLVKTPSEATLPKELIEMIKSNICQLCSMKLTSRMQARMHYKARSHWKKVRNFMVNYCREKKIPLPTEFSFSASTAKESTHALIQKYGYMGTSAVKKDNERDTYCRICQVTLPTALHAEQHYQGRNHTRRLDGKPPLRPGYINLMTGKWQRTPPTEEDFKPHRWTFATAPVKRKLPKTIDLSSEDDGGSSSSKSFRFDPGSADEVIVIPGDGEKKKSR